MRIIDNGTEEIGRTYDDRVIIQLIYCRVIPGAVPYQQSRVRQSCLIAP
jgi:hypothetical protein